MENDYLEQDFYASLHEDNFKPTHDMAKQLNDVLGTDLSDKDISEYL